MKTETGVGAVGMEKTDTLERQVFMIDITEVYQQLSMEHSKKEEWIDA